MLALQLLANGLALGAAYALVALGFVLALKASGAVNFAHGDLVTAGGFVAVALASLLPVPGVILLPLTVLLMAGLGMAVAALGYLPLRDRPAVAVFVSTIAIGIVLRNGLDGIFGAAPRSAPPLAGGGTVEIAGLVLARQSIAIMITAAAIATLLHLLLIRSRTGWRMRAAAEDPEMARALGIPVTAMTLLAFALSAALAGTAGLLLANQYFVTPEEGGPLMLKAYIAATLGGWGRLDGAVAGAFVIALFEVGVAALLSAPVAEAMLAVGVIALLWLRPQGLFGEHAGRRA